MATKYYYFEGMCKWAKVRQPDEKYNNYTLDLYLTPESFALLNSSGLELKLREDEEGKFVKFRRPSKKLIKDDVVNFGPPTVIDSNDEEIPSNVLIGNGSTVICKVAIYDTIKGKGHRLETVKVLDLVVYGGNEPPEYLGIEVPF